MSRWATSTGGAVTADTREAAARIADEYGMGEIVARAAAPVKPRAPMSLTRAKYLYGQADEWPRCGQGWPIDCLELEAAAVLDAAGIEP